MLWDFNMVIFYVLPSGGSLSLSLSIYLSLSLSHFLSLSFSSVGTAQPLQKCLTVTHGAFIPSTHNSGLFPYSIASVRFLRASKECAWPNQKMWHFLRDDGSSLAPTSQQRLPVPPTSGLGFTSSCAQSSRVESSWADLQSDFPHHLYSATQSWSKTLKLILKQYSHPLPSRRHMITVPEDCTTAPPRKERFNNAN